MHAIILAAGIGKRLSELTKENTKCMICLNGKRLVEYTIQALLYCGIKKIVMVVGYKYENLKSFLDNQFKDVDITYIENEDYYRTNNIFSLALAKQFLIEDDTILMESDLIFDKEILRSCVNNQSPNVAVVGKFESWMDGTVTILNDNDYISSFISKNDFNWNDTGNYYKTVNIYKLSKEFSINKFVPFLDAYIASKGNNEYYEQVLRLLAFIAPNQLKASKVGDLNWYEIDDKYDLDIASTIFSDKDTKTIKFQKRSGGYWNFLKLKDFYSLVNPNFPSRTLLAELKNNFEQLLTNYPSNHDIQNLLVSKMFSCEERQIVVGNGTLELIKGLMRHAKMNVGIAGSAFNEYIQIIEDGRLTQFESENDNFSYTGDDLFEFAVKKDLSTLILINPNLSGRYLEKKAVIYLVKKLHKNGIQLILDESFVDFVDGSSNHTLISDEILHKYNNLIIIKSISKAYGIPGLRLSILISGNIETVNSIKAEIPKWNVNSLGEYFLQVIGKYKSEYENSCKLLCKERERFFTELNKINYLVPTESKSNYILCEVIAKFTASELTSRLLNDSWILIEDLTGKIGFEGSEYIRLAIRNKEDNNYLIKKLEKM